MIRDYLWPWVSVWWYISLSVLCDVSAGMVSAEGYWRAREQAQAEALIKCCDMAAGQRQTDVIYKQEHPPSTGVAFQSTVEGVSVSACVGMCDLPSETAICMSYVYLYLYLL